MNWRFSFSLAAPWKVLEANGLLRRVDHLSIKTQQRCAAGGNRVPAFQGSVRLQLRAAQSNQCGLKAGQSLQILCMIWE